MERRSTPRIVDHMILRCVYLAVVFNCGTMPFAVMADSPPDGPHYNTIDELFTAYKKATEDRDWKTLFLLGTPEQQNVRILDIAVNAATSSDGTLRSLVEKHGGNWKQFDHAWTEEDNQRFMREYPAVAASLGKQVTQKLELFVAAQSHIYRNGDPWSTRVHELINVVHRGATAVGESMECRTSIERHYDVQGNPTRQIPRTVSVRSRLWFRQIDGHWFLAAETEVATEH